MSTGLKLDLFNSINGVMLKMGGILGIYVFCRVIAFLFLSMPTDLNGCNSHVIMLLA